MASDDNGLYYMRARYYNIDIRRFVNQDVLTGSIERSSSLNRYAYVEGNPVSYLDPFGLEKFRFDTSLVHKALTVLSLTVLAASAIAIAASGGATAIYYLAMYTSLSNIIATVDTLLYVYDFCTARNEEERNAAIIGVGLNVIGFRIGDAIADLKSIQYLFSGIEREIIEQVIAFDYNAHVAAISSYLEGGLWFE